MTHRLQKENPFVPITATAVKRGRKGLTSAVPPRFADRITEILLAHSPGLTIRVER
jgi:hypothetical protein